MNFKEYSQRFLSELNPKGDLARDMQSDGGFPETKDFDEVGAYLIKMHAAPEVIMIAEEMFKKYSEEVK